MSDLRFGLRSLAVKALIAFAPVDLTGLRRPAGTAAGVTVDAFAAAALPPRRAARIDPMNVLRAE